MNKYVGLIAFGFSAAALAQGSMPTFEEVDANGDGLISQEEAQAIEGLDFATADANQDGSLSRDEYSAVEGQE